MFLHQQNARMENMMQMMQHDRPEAKGERLANVRMDERNFRNVPSSTTSALIGKNGSVASWKLYWNVTSTSLTSLEHSSVAKILSTTSSSTRWPRTSCPLTCTSVWYLSRRVQHSKYWRVFPTSIGLKRGDSWTSNMIRRPMRGWQPLSSTYLVTRSRATTYRQGWYCGKPNSCP